MNTKSHRFTLLIIIVAALLALTAGLTLAKDGPLNLLAPQAPVGTGFTYQGQLTDGGSPAAGSFDFQFDLYDVEADGTLLGTVTLEDVAVTDGLFTVTLDFGAGAFDGDARWLAISVRPGSETGDFTALTPRQALTAAPYAQYAVEAGTVAWDGVSDNPIPGGCAEGEIMAWDDALSVWACVENVGTTYNAGFGLGLDSTTFNVLTDTVQTRVTGDCAAGSTIQTINADGTVVCEADDDTTYAAGTALELDGTTFNVLTDTVQTRVTGSCAAGSMVSAVNADGTVVCEADGDTTYTAGTALELDGTTFNVLTDTVQTRVTGECVVGSAIQTINADGTAVCEPHDTRPIFSQTVLDTDGDVGSETFIVIGADGLPIISYRDVTNDSLKVAHCNDTACTSATTSTLDTSGRIEDTSIAIGADGLPIISYYKTIEADLKVAHCNNIACTSATITSLDTAGNVGAFTSIIIGVDGLPIISYYHYHDAANSDLKVAHCDNVACTSATFNSPDTVGAVGAWTSIIIGSDGLPIISYWDGTNDDLKVAHCDDIACASATSSAVDSAGSVGRDSLIAIGADGLPIILYTGNNSTDLKVAHCDDITCTSATITELYTGSTYIQGSITIGADSLPIISFRENLDNANLNVAHCNNTACTTFTWLSLDNTSAHVGATNSITIGTDGMPIISYYDKANGNLKVTHCSNAFCVPFFRRR